MNYFTTASYWNLEQVSVSNKQPEHLEVSADDDVVREEEHIKSRIGRCMGAENVIELRGVRKSFKRNIPGLGIGDFHAVKCPWFGMQKKSFSALLGPNGAGKTTVINMLTGVLPLTSGEALVLDQLRRIRVAWPTSVEFLACVRSLIFSGVH